jgi:endonuclease III
MRASLRRKAAAINRLLNEAHHTPDLGNRQDPVEELVFISLSRQTHEANTARSWRALEAAGGVEAIHGMPLRRLERLLKPAGLSRQKACWIKAALSTIHNRFGVLSLNRARAWTDKKLERFLCSLPGISLKSAKCIMMYSMERRVLPVDTHVRRLATRIGLIPSGLSERETHEQLEAIVGPDRRFSFHVNAIVHGRTVCTVRAPHCQVCVVRAYCDHAANLEHHIDARTPASRNPLGPTP